MADEAIFYLAFLRFLQLYHGQYLTEGGGFTMPMREWKELYETVLATPGR